MKLVLATIYLYDYHCLTTTLRTKKYVLFTRKEKKSNSTVKARRNSRYQTNAEHCRALQEIP